MNATTRQGVTGGPLENLGELVEGVSHHSAAGPATHPTDTLRIEIFQDIAPLNARMVALGAMDLHEAVDALQQFAERFGLVDTIGQDEVQAIMAAAFDLEGCDEG